MCISLCFDVRVVVVVDRLHEPIDSHRTDIARNRKLYWQLFVLKDIPAEQLGMHASRKMDFENEY